MQAGTATVRPLSGALAAKQPPHFLRAASPPRYSEAAMLPVPPLPLPSAHRGTPVLSPSTTRRGGAPRAGPASSLPASTRAGTPRLAHCPPRDQRATKPSPSDNRRGATPVQDFDARAPARHPQRGMSPAAV